MPTQRRLELPWVAAAKRAQREKRELQSLQARASPSVSGPSLAAAPRFRAFRLHPHPKPRAVHVGGGLACQWAGAA
jgi:hypothetical protein